MALPSSHWARARGRPRVAAVALSILLFLVLVLSAQQTVRAPYDGLVLRDTQVARVSPGSPGEQAGIRPGDYLLRSAPVRVRPVPGATREYVLRRDGEELRAPVTLTALPKPELARRLGQTLLSLLFLAVGLVVYLERSDKVGTLFFLTCFCFAGVFATRPPMLGSWEFLMVKTFHNVCVILLPAFFLHFFLVFPQRKGLLLRHPVLEKALYAPVLALLLVSGVFDLLITREGTVRSAAETFQNGGSLLLTLYYLAGVVSFVHSFRAQQSLALKRQLRYVLAGTLLGAGPLVVITLVLGLWPSAEIPGFRYAFLTLILIPVSFAHAIVKYHLMDLDLIVRRSVAYTLLTAALVAIYVGVVEGLGGYLLHLTGRLTLALSVASIFIIALVFSTLRDRIQRLVDRLFYMGRYSFPDTLREFGNLLASPLGLTSVLEEFARRLSDVLKVENVLILLREPPAPGFVVRAEAGRSSAPVGDRTIAAEKELVAWLKEEQMPLPLERLREHPRFRTLPTEDRSALDRMGTALLAPVISDRELLAIVSVGPRKSQEPLSRQDLALVEALTSHAARTLEAATLRVEKEAGEKIRQELEIARQIQSRLLPKSPPKVRGLEVCATTVPCHEVGGDFYDFIVLDDGRLGVAIADVCGKGVSAALLMAALQAAFHAEAETQLSPAAVLRRANERLLEKSGPERFASLFYGIVDPGRNRLVYASAGHDPALLVRAGGEVESLDSTGLLLGICEDAQFIDRELCMSSGDLLLLYTDGVTEELNEDEEPFGQVRLRALLTDDWPSSAKGISEKILDAVRGFTMDSIQDDVTLVTVAFE